VDSGILIHLNLLSWNAQAIPTLGHISALVPVGLFSNPLKLEPKEMTMKAINLDDLFDIDGGRMLTPQQCEQLTELGEYHAYTHWC